MEVATSEQVGRSSGGHEPRMRAYVALCAFAGYGSVKRRG